MYSGKVGNLGPLLPVSVLLAPPGFSIATQTAVTAIVLPAENREKPVAVQPVCAAFGPLSLTNASSSLLTVAPPPITEVAGGHPAVAFVPVLESGESGTVVTSYCTPERDAALIPVSVFWLICLSVREFALT